MSSSLVPERPLQISPSLAATIGLEEAAMLSLLDEMAAFVTPQMQGALAWYTFSEPQLAARMPFWTDHDIERISQSLRAKGILLLHSAPFGQSRLLCFAFNESVSGQDAPAPAPQRLPVYDTTSLPAGRQVVQAHNQISRGATVIPPGWQPSHETLAALAQHNIPESFIRQQLPEFVTFWRESGESHRSWGAKFQQQVMRKWREHENFVATREQEVPMTTDWRPSRDALEVLVRHAGISLPFVEDAVPEFVLYWFERGEICRTWNSKFIQHVRRQWAKYTSALEHDTEPRRIPENWQPSEDVYDVLRLANIDLTFAQNLLSEFVIFWRDSNQVHNSWNTKFLQHVKYHWARRHQLSSAQGSSSASSTGNSIGSSDAGHQANLRTRDRSLVDDLNDRSWAL